MNILLITISNLVFLLIGIYLGRFTKSSKDILLPGNNTNISMPTIDKPFPVVIIEKTKGFKSYGDDEEVVHKGRRINLRD